MNVRKCPNGTGVLRKMVERSQEEKTIDLEKRLKLIESSLHKNVPLTRLDHVLLFIAGIVVPMALMFWGWFT